MTAAAKIDIPGCGTYSYKITGPGVPPPNKNPPPPPPPSLGSQWCYDQNAFGKHNDIQERFQVLGAKLACEKMDGHKVKEGDAVLHTKYAPAIFRLDVPYVYEIYWEPNCKSTVNEMDAGKPLPDKNGITCESLLTGDYKNCKSCADSALIGTDIFACTGENGGIGGKISVGCLTYVFKASDSKS
jgi:hypothetical protein